MSFIRSYTWGVKVFCIPLVLAFSFVDLFYAPSFAEDFLVLRLSIGLLAFYSLLLFRFKKIRAALHEFPAIILSLILGCYHAVMIYQTGGAGSSYYMGVGLAAVGMTILAPWRERMLALSLLFHYAPTALVLFFGSAVVDSKFLVPHLSFAFALQAMACYRHRIDKSLKQSEILERL